MKDIIKKVLEEYHGKPYEEWPEEGRPKKLTLSYKGRNPSKEKLIKTFRNLLDYFEKHDEISVEDVAYTMEFNGIQWAKDIRAYQEYMSRQSPSKD